MKRWGVLVSAFGLTLSLCLYSHAIDSALSPTNVALAANGGVATASSAGGAYPVTYVNDGVLVPANKGYWRDTTANRWPDAVVVTFQGQKNLARIGVVTAQTRLGSTTVPVAGVTTFTSNGIRAYSVQYCSDRTASYTTTCPVRGTGTKWVQVRSVTGNALVWRVFNFTPVTTQRIRISVTAALQNYSRIVEIEAYESSAGQTPTLSFATADSSGAESVTPVRLSVNLSTTSGRTVTVPYTVSGTATGGGVDYNLANGTLSFSPGTTNQTLTFPVVDDNLAEGNETVVVTLGTPTNATLGAIPTHTYTILDNDPTNAPPSTAGVIPAAAVSLMATTKPFTARYSDRDGYEDLARVQFRIETSAGSGANALWTQYDRQLNRIFLVNDAGTGALATSCTPGEALVLENSQGQVDCAAISVSGSGAMLTVQWYLTPKAPLAGGVSHPISMQAADQGNLTSGWVQAGNWTVRDTLPAFSRPLPVTTSGIQIFADQLTDGLSDAQNRFVAEHMVGVQKMTQQLTDPIRDYNPAFLVLQYRLTYGLSSVFNITDLNTWDLDTLEPSYPGSDPRKTAEAYYYHHQGSRVLHADSYALADIRNGDWRDYQIRELLRRMPTNDFDGVFLDTAHIRIDGFTPYNWYEGYCNPDIRVLDDCWRRDAIPYLTDLRDRLHFSGPSAWYAIGNFGALITGWDSDDYLYPLDGGMIENFMLDEGTPLHQADWHIAADRILRLIGNDRILIAQPYIGTIGDLATRKFVLGNFLLFKGRHAFLSNYTGEFDSVGPPVWFPEYEVPIGAPRGAVPETAAGYCQGSFGGSSCSGAYERDFTCGSVLVNPHDSARSYTLPKLGPGFSYGEFTFTGGGYVTSSGQKAPQSIQYPLHGGLSGQLPAHSARVLIHLNAAGTPTCTGILPPDPPPVLESLVLPAAADTWIGVRDDEGTHNYGGATQLRTYSNDLTGGNTRFTLIRFDLSSLPAGATIMDARLDFTAEAILYPDTALMRVQRVTNSWVEGTQAGEWWETPDGATWTSRGPGLPDWTTAGVDVAEEVCQLTALEGHNGSCSLTVLARQWAAGALANNGVRLSNVNAYNDDLFISSRQGATPEDHPRLLVRYTLGDPGALDTDDDGILDISDNCPFDANPDQADSDQDSLGDVCDPTPQGPPANDGDGIPDEADNCPSVYNPDQADSDRDGIGDACDPTPYGSGFGDGDGIADDADNCPGVYNPSQADSDHDGIGDACDPTPNGAGSHADLRDTNLAIIAGRTGDYAGNATLAQPSGLTAFHRSGQTFITWSENNAIAGETYILYRHSQPIGAANLAQATPIAMVAEGSSLYPTEVSRGRGQTRYIINDLDTELTATTGLHVHTVASAGSWYYAVITTAGGSANKTVFTPGNSLAVPVKETVADPLPILVGSGSDGYGNTSRIYTQFMDPLSWNVTLHGYAYNYSVTVPQGYNPEATNRLPLTLHIEGKGSRYAITEPYSFGIYLSIDAPYLYGDGEQDWFWGYSCHHDFRNATNFDVVPGPICNFSEVRTLRAIRDTLRDPYYRNHADTTRIYAYGHSMGGSGVISWGMHYPRIFTLVYASQGMTDYATDPVWRSENIGRFGPLALNNPVLNLGIAWLDGRDTREAIGNLDGMGIWDYLDHKTLACSPAYQGMETTYLIAAHGTADDIIQPASQGYPFYDCLNEGRRGFTAEINDSGHTWQGYTPEADIDFRIFTFPWNAQEDALPNTPGLDRDFPLQSYIAFANATGSTLGVTTGLAHYNRSLQWDLKTLVDQANRYEVDLYARGTDQTADVTPRRLRHFIVTPGENYRYTNQRTGATGRVTADGHGVLTIPAVRISTLGSRLVIVPE